MVKNSGKCFLLIIACAFFALNSCNVDLLGLFGSNDLSRRWDARNSFKFLKDADRNLALGSTYSFLVVTDTHIDDNKLGKSDYLGLRKLKDIIDNENIKFVVFCGDVTQKGTRKEIQEFIDVAQTLGVPCFPIVGNHDVYQGNWPEWESLIGSTVYRIDSDSDTFLMLDSANAFLGAKQLDWLESELNRANGKAFVFSHTNFFIKSPVDLQQLTDVRERARAMSILQGRAEIIFMGHLHKRVINDLGGVEYVAIEDFRDQAAYCKVDVTPDGFAWNIKNLSR